MRFLVEGSVRRIGDRFRILVHLVEAATEAQLWSEHFDRDISDIFTVQDEVVQMIVAKVAGQLELAEARRVRRKRTEESLRPTTAICAGWPVSIAMRERTWRRHRRGLRSRHNSIPVMRRRCRCWQWSRPSRASMAG